MKTQKKPVQTIDKDRPTKRTVQSYEPTYANDLWHGSMNIAGHLKRLR